MLGRLDDELDAIAPITADLPEQMAGEPIRGLPIESTEPLPIGALTSNQSIGARPIIKSTDQRLPLSKVVHCLVNQWSEGFVQLAIDGDASSMCLVAQMYFFHKGYGLIKPNRSKGIEWILKAVDAGDIESREFARRFCPIELKQHLESTGRDDSKLKLEEDKANHHFK